MRNRKMLLLFVWMLISVVFLWRGPSGESRGLKSQQAAPGSVATGVVISEDNNALILDTTPCEKAEDKKLLQFNKPYVKLDEGAKRCGDKIYNLVQVTKN